jgi:hypothetical protein
VQKSAINSTTELAETADETLSVRLIRHVDSQAARHRQSLFSVQASQSSMKIATAIFPQEPPFGRCDRYKCLRQFFSSRQIVTLKRYGPSPFPPIQIAAVVSAKLFLTVFEFAPFAV